MKTNLHSFCNTPALLNKLQRFFILIKLTIPNNRVKTNVKKLVSNYQYEKLNPENDSYLEYTISETLSEIDVGKEKYAIRT